MINSQRIVIKSAPIASLIRRYNLQALATPPIIKNPYEGKTPDSYEADPELYKSSLGTPVVIDLTFKPVTYNDYVTGKSKTTDQLTFVTVLCTVSQAKKIIKTEIQGLNGTVKEYIGLDDFAININGIITGGNGQYPGAEVTALDRVLQAPVAVPVVSSFLNRLGIFSIVIEEYALPQDAGRYSTQDFSINALSDTPLELKIV